LKGQLVISNLEGRAGPNSSYRHIVKSSAIIGGSSVINMVLGIIRTKSIAILLGPSGVGLMGIYVSVTTMMTMLFGMGLNGSGVRQIAEVNADGDSVRLGRTISSLTRTSFILGGIGALILTIMAEPIGRLTFGTAEHSRSMALVSVTILLTVVANGQTAIVQGLQRVRDLALINIMGGLGATLIGVPLIFFFRERGIVPVVMVLSLMTITASGYAVGRINVEKVKISWREFTEDAAVLLRLGAVFMASGVMASANAYLVRVLIVRQLGMDGAGQYQAAWALSGIYVGFVLGAMGTDFYPRLTAAANDGEACTRLANEQAEIAILLALPGILATIAFAPVVMTLLYSGRFEPAVRLLQWQMLGVLLKVCAFPIGFIILAKGAGRLFLMTEALTYAVSLALSWWCLKWLGLVGAGVAFLGMYAFCALIVYGVVRRNFGFDWSASNRRLACLVVPAALIVFIVSLTLPPTPGVLVSGTVSAIISYIFLKRLVALVGTSRLPGPVRTLGRGLRLIPAIESPEGNRRSPSISRRSIT
jgi:antigen flippase